MEVQLYVYDLSKGLARQFSQQFLGTYIDAVYHTAIVIQNIEYFFGAGVQTTYAGSTHHGQPMEVISMGKTELPLEVILEYLESLKEVYTAESYDLFMHNCNNFSNDFAMFLVGKGIPDHITSLPQTVLNTPFGMMLRPQLDQAMRSVTQAPVAPVMPPTSHASLAEEPMTFATDPLHPHTKLNKTMKTLKVQQARCLHFSKMPTLDKLIAKLGDQGKQPVVADMKTFLNESHSKVPQNARLPSLPDFATWMSSSIKVLPLDSQFAAYDLFRLALADERVGAYFAEKSHSGLVLDLLKHVNEMGDSCPSNLCLVSCQLSCNFLASKVARAEVPKMVPICTEITSLALSTLLDDEQGGVRGNARSAAAWTVCNLASANFTARLEGHGMGEEQEVEVLAGLLSALDAEPKDEIERVAFLVSAIGLLVWHAPIDGGVADLCRSLDALENVKRRMGMNKDHPQVGEVCTLLESFL